ncbi:MAG TPA: helix-turn-helix transcriptional regulator [Pedobacter sp.]|jgi:transcriptional regulator with XRE-family HTH domain
MSPVDILGIFELEGVGQKFDIWHNKIPTVMYPSPSDSKFTVAQLLARLRLIYKPDNKALAEALRVSYTTYLNTERGYRELSFLMALRICQFYKLDLHDFISMLSDEELRRPDVSIIKAHEKIERKKAEAIKAKVIDIKTEQVVSHGGR